MKTHVGMEVAASGNLEVSLLVQGGTSPLPATGLLGATSGGLLGEVHMEGSPGVVNRGFDRRSSISSIMLGPVAISLGHSITECREETSINDCRGMAFRKSS